MSIEKLANAELDRSGRRTLWAAVAAVVLLIVVCMAYAAGARADTNLAVVAGAGCVAGPVGAPCSERYDVPADADLVRVSPTNTSWSTGFAWKRWKDLAAGERYEGCGSDVPRGSAVAGGACTSWPWLAKAAPPTNAGGRMPLSWAAPTFNVDGSVVKAGLGTKIFCGTAADKLALMITLPLPDTVSQPYINAYTVTGLAPGTWYCALRAYTETGLESDNSKIVSETIGAPPQPVPVPKPPGSVALAELPAFDVQRTANQATAKQIGTAPANTKYLAISMGVAGVGYCAVDRGPVKLLAGITSKPALVFVKC